MSEINSSGVPQINIEITPSQVTTISSTVEAGTSIETPKQYWEDYADNIVVVQDEEPTHHQTKIWFPETDPEGIEVPTYAEFQELEEGVADLQSDVEVLTPTNAGTAGQILRKKDGGGCEWDNAATTQEVGAAVTAWLDEHATQSENYIEVENTLTVSGAAADSKTVGDKIGEIKSALNSKDVDTPLSGWEQGGINTTNGASYASTTTIRKHNRYGLSNGVHRISCSSSYFFIVYAWDSTGTYLGAYKTSGAINKTNSGWATLTEFDCSKFPTYTFKVAFYNSDSSAITPDKGQYCIFSCFTDKTLSMENKAADGKATGDAVQYVKDGLSIPFTYKVLSKNIFDGVWESGSFDASTGVEIENPNQERTGYISIDNTNSTLYYLRQTADDGKLWAMYYTSAKAFVQRTVVFADGDTTLKNTDSIPATVAYVRLMRGASATGYVDVSYEELSANDPYVAGYAYKNESIPNEALQEETQEAIQDANGIFTELFDTKVYNIFDGTFPNSGYFDANGADAAGTSYMRTDYIPIDDSNSILYFLRSVNGYQLACCFYNSSKVIVGSRWSPFAGGSTGYTETATIPTNAAYIRMYTKISDYSGNLMLSYDSYPSYITPGEHPVFKDKSIALNNLTDKVKSMISPLAGKTIAFMGDSIIGNFYDASGVCAQLAKLTGATVINCAFGGTRIAYRYGSNVQYPYWNALSGVGLANAIASGTWTDQDTAVANMTSALDYFAARLATVKAVDWSKVDFIMWEYGTNDFMTEVALSDDSDPTNMYAYSNAYRHVIETIQTAYPNIRIITATPIYRWYESGGVYTTDSNSYQSADYNGVLHKLTDFVAMAQQVSREYQIPCIDDYYTLGANRFTRLQFFNASDGTHPKAEGRRMIAEHLAAQLGSLV